MSRYVYADEEPQGRYVFVDDTPTVVKAGNALNDIPRQVGLTARYGLEGLGQALQVGTEPIRYLMDKVTPEREQTLSGLVTGEKKPKSLPLSMVASNVADWIGLPKPQNATERVVGDATRLVAGGGGVMGLSGALSRSASGVTQNVLQSLASNPMQQTSAAVGAGLAGGSSREAGGGDLQQAGSALLGGVAGGLVPGLVNAGTSAVRGVVGKMTQTPAQIDQRLNVVFERAGMDYSQVPERVRQSLRTEAASAIAAGRDLNPQALGRLADFKALNVTPTKGMVTLDPVQITREQNLAKIGANSADGQLQGLARTQNENNQRFIQVLNEGGANRGDAMSAGQRAINSIQAQDDALKSAVSERYTAARAMPGADIPLNRSAVVNSVFDALAKENKMAYLPESISNTLNTVSQGVIERNGQRFEVPFTANVLDNLLTDIATAQRGTQDGNVKAALKIARDAITATPIQPVKNTFGGNQLVTDAGAQFLRAKDAQAGQYMDALNEARKAAAQRFGWQESSRPVEAALGGAQPDDFVKRFVIGGKLSDVQALKNTVDIAPLKDAVVGYLKDRALSGAADEVGKFSQSAFNKAIRDIGKEKMATLFSQEELDQLQRLGRVASYAQAQPIGSAVNNSNSGALMLGRGLDVLNQIPILGPNIAPAIKNIEVGIQQRAAQNVGKGLLAPQQQISPRAGLLAPVTAYSGGLLAPPMVNDR